MGEMIQEPKNSKLNDAFSYLEFMFCKRGNVGYAMQLVEKMEEHGCPPNTVTYNSLVRGLCIQRNLQQSLQLLDKLMRKGLVPNVLTYSFLLEAANRERGVDEAMRLLDEIIAKETGLEFCNKEIKLRDSSFYGVLADIEDSESGKLSNVIKSLPIIALLPKWKYCRLKIPMIADLGVVPIHDKLQESHLRWHGHIQQKALRCNCKEE
ncbi:pentatricopeptide repeat-containing protein At5g16420, mitochondrial-like [Macadamia integrifolia]|uniref:pentatricopeptide repeat-containing protein At5g16420, mitochondrial-like n=1 Tax=Macadamia integrifolia TaxID=60698 RepID=UPI001C502101|nr:pentatricopeptide repeat-containing protein At5g16420, mitochondrial-like [Macadamia integrifolia]